jgi:hypothetical protein
MNLSLAICGAKVPQSTPIKRPFELPELEAWQRQDLQGTTRSREFLCGFCHKTFEKVRPPVFTGFGEALTSKIGRFLGETRGNTFPWGVPALCLHGK